MSETRSAAEESVRFMETQRRLVVWGGGIASADSAGG